MIKSNELRIGNYCLLTTQAIKSLFDCCDVITDNIYFPVSQFSPDEIYIYVGDDSVETEFGYDEIEPIPITEEVLLRCGASTGANTYKVAYYSISYCNGYIYFHFVKGELKNQGIAIIDNNTKVDEVGTYVDIKHLHQLQNLYFALTTKELEIKL